MPGHAGAAAVAQTWRGKEARQEGRAQRTSASEAWQRVSASPVGLAPVAPVGELKPVAPAGPASGSARRALEQALYTWPAGPMARKCISSSCTCLTPRLMHLPCTSLAVAVALLTSLCAYPHLRISSACRACGARRPQCSREGCTGARGRCAGRAGDALRSGCAGRAGG